MIFHPFWLISLSMTLYRSIHVAANGIISFFLNDWVILHCVPWRRKWHPTPIFLSGEFLGQRSLASYSPWGHKESVWLSTIFYCMYPLYSGIVFFHSSVDGHLSCFHVLAILKISFSGAYWPSVHLLWINVYSGLLPIFWVGCLFWCCQVSWTACKFWRLIPYQSHHL